MRKQVWIAFLFLLLAAGGVWAGAMSRRRLQALATDGVLRLHVIGASDDEDDQRRKLLVRDSLLAVYGQDLAACQTAEEASRTVSLLSADMEATARAALRADGREQDVVVRQVYEHFPTRNYNGQVYPAGVYHAVKVLIGPAKGHNWWCVLFPPLCVSGYGVWAEPAECTPTPSPTAPLPPVSESSPQPTPGSLVAEEAPRLSIRWLGMEWLQKLFGLGG
nr:stage II sporulation protein R [bacterium]